MRKLFVKIHLWLSIPFGIIITIVCLTGAILVFETEILQLCYPSRYFVKEVAGKPLQPAELINAARRQLPDSPKIKGLRIFQDPERTYQLVLPGKKEIAFINPYTAEVTGIDDGQGFFMKTMRLHRWLLDKYKRDGSFSWGKVLVGYATLMLVFISISGIVIWYPRNRNVLKNRLKIKTKAGMRRFFYDLHVSGGFYAVLLLLVMALTGLTWSFDWYRTAFYSVFGVHTTQTKTQIVAATDILKKRTDGDTSERKRENQGNGKEGGKQRDKTDYTQWAEVLSDLQERYPEYNSIVIQDGSATVSANNYGNTRGSDRFTFEPSTGRITDIQLYGDLPKSDKMRGWIYSVHVGSWGGLTTRILSCLVSLLGGVLAITGYYFWIRRKI